MFKDNWIQTLAELEQKGEGCILVTVIEHRGSTPRDSGAKMLVTRTGCHATIGGGHLEYKAMALAREMLANGERQLRIERFNLGASLGQCCGGMATLMLEPVVPERYHLVLFGAGHVAKALVRVLTGLPFRITWIDEREDEFPDRLPEGITRVISDDPVGEVDAQPPHSFYLVMTHHHQLDFELAVRILKRGDARYFGMIGSRTKRKRFEYRLQERGLEAQTVSRMVCPIGLAGVGGKHPAEIAVSVAAQLIACYQDGAVLESGVPAANNTYVVSPPHT